MGYELESDEIRAEHAENQDGAYKQLLSIAQAFGFDRIWEDPRPGRSGEWFMERTGESGMLELLPFSAIKAACKNSSAIFSPVVSINPSDAHQP